ncbi:MAG: AAA family ATPase [Lachnospiraceae bacterium]|nr:AAA family ATPase [Lachnospiraceae bacterium]
MFEICPKCGNYEWNKEVSVDKRSARCPKCGASWENRAFPLFILTGCSGVGKTTTARRLMERQQDYAVLDGDILFTADEGEYMGWVERIEGLARDFMQCGKPVLWTMAGNLDKLKKACNERFFADIYCLALVCGEAELRRRMTEGRGISDDGWIRDSVSYNNYFLEHDRMDDIVIERLDITVLDPDQAAQQVERWMRSKLAAWRAGGTTAAASVETVRMSGTAQMLGRMPETGNAQRAGGNFAEGTAWRPNRELGEKTAGGS